jgi:hypothetical protein
VLNQHNIFETTLAEFLFHLYLPLENRSRFFRKNFNRWRREGTSYGQRENYAVWLKILEGHYMTFLNRPIIRSAARARVLKNFEIFMIARNETIQDYLQMLPIVIP